ncbi:MAG: hypothetical protein AAGF12_38180 [Myxococcota bacterium]
MRVLVILWGIGGVLALLGQALTRLTPIAWDAMTSGLSTAEWLVLGGWVAFNGYAEGHRGFHLRFSPRVVARAFHLADHPKPLHVILAPAFCMSLFHATRRRMIASWILIAAITIVVVLVRLLEQPWRGIVDAGVVVGLGWGSLSILYHLARAIKTRPAAPEDLPLSGSEAKSG